MKSLRLERRWSQEELAQLSDLNVRTIQRVEKGQSVGAETLKALAAVFEISTDELAKLIESEKCMPQTEDAEITHSQKNKAIEKVKSIKYFYALSTFLVALFLLFMLPNYNEGENLGPLIVVFLSFSTIIAGYAFIVFKPFGEDWEQKKVAEILNQKNERNGASSE